MGQLYHLCWLLIVFSTAKPESTFHETGASGRGPRPVEHGSKAACTSQKEWPICLDEDWGPKCPSGCRIQGLLTKADKDLADKIDKIRKFLDENRNKYRSADQITKTTYDVLREKLVLDTGADNRFQNLADQLRQRIIDMKLKIDQQIRLLIALKSRVRDQVNEMQRIEVDIDIKIRSCKGSCASAHEYRVDRDSYVTLDKQLSQLDSVNMQSVETVSSLRVMKSRPLKEVSTVSSIYKSRVANGSEQELTLFKDIEQVRLSLEVDDTRPKGSPAVTVTSGRDKQVSGSKDEVKDPKTDSVVTTHTKVLQCTKTIRKKTVFTKDGPVETVEVVGGSPECENLGLGVDDAALLSAAKETKDIGGGYTVKVTGSSGGVDRLSEFFPDIDSLFRREHSTTTTTKEFGGSGSSITTTTTRHTDQPKVIKTVVHTERGDGDFVNLGDTDDFHTFEKEVILPGGSIHDGFGGFEGGGSSSYSKTSVVSGGSNCCDGDHSSSSVTGTKTVKTSMYMGDDLGAFQFDDEEEDLPDFRARSLKKEPVKRQKDYIGRDCADISQNHGSGTKSGLFKIKPEGTEDVVEVYCDQETLLGGWVLVQQRMDGSVDFNRTWEEYKHGFGSVNKQGQGELWLGNKYLNLLTQKESILRVELEDWEGNEVYAEYSVSVGSESEGYILKVSHYDGDAGDALIKGETKLSTFLSHNNMKFSTYDKDSDKWEENCAEMYGGGWWYNNCQSANLNGMYYSGGLYDPGSKIPYEIENGVVWLPFKPANYSLKVVRIKIRPAETQ
ncbi:FIBA protein, partial [Atractosteus spatula]|nr:FIBA protein [Atractosteus spatula]